MACQNPSYLGGAEWRIKLGVRVRHLHSSLGNEISKKERNVPIKALSEAFPGGHIFNVKECTLPVKMFVVAKAASDSKIPPNGAVVSLFGGDYPEPGHVGADHNCHTLPFCKFGWAEGKIDCCYGNKLKIPQILKCLMVLPLLHGSWKPM